MFGTSQPQDLRTAQPHHESHYQWQDRDVDRTIRAFRKTLSPEQIPLFEAFIKRLKVIDKRLGLNDARYEKQALDYITAGNYPAASNAIALIYNESTSERLLNQFRLEVDPDEVAKRYQAAFDAERLIDGNETNG